jgi:glycerophosphoryl diester phosphodiesterase
MSISHQRRIIQGPGSRIPAWLGRWLLSLLIVFGTPLYFAAELSSSAYTASSPRSVLARLYEKSSPLRWPSAHRGAQVFGPENSLDAVLGAAQAGIPLIEVDVRRNADGTLFLYHDRRLDERKVTGPSQLIGRRAESLDDRELQLLRYAGGAPSHLATYAEALDAVAPYRTALQLDVKGEPWAVIDQAVHIAREQGQAHQIVIQCQRLSTLAYVREKFPDIAVLARAHSIAEVRKAYRKLPDIIQIEEAWITPALVQEIHAAGSKILVKSLDDMDTVEHWQRLFDAGVDIVLTDKAVQMVRHLRAAPRLNGAP